MADLHELMTRFLQEPSTDTFATLRSAVVEDPRWHPYAGDIEALQSLLKEERWAEIAGRFQAAMPSLMLCPEAHLIAAEGARRCGDEQGGALLLHIANQLLRAILATGDGSVERPYLVTNVSDQYLVLWAQSATFSKQRLDRRGDRRVDRFTCEDAAEVCFDITDMHNRIGADLNLFLQGEDN